MMVLMRHMAVTMIALMICSALARVRAEPRAPVLICTNPASGTSWQINIDYDRAAVDSYPAKVSDGEISWHDAKDGGNYTLDRKSGDLKVVVASSTGGYILHDHCGPPP